jgi:replicative DNA helicase
MSGNSTLEPRLLADIDIERSVIGACLADQSQVAEIVDQLQPTDFYLEWHQEIFEKITEMAHRRKHVDALTVSDALPDKSADESIRAYLLEIAFDHYTSLFVQEYISVIQSYALKRRMRTVGSKIVEMVYDADSEPDQIISATEKLVLDASAQNRPRQMHTTGSLMESVIERMEQLANGEILPGIPTGWAGLDTLLNGWQRGNVITLAARPGMGKSAFAINTADFISRVMNLNVLFFTLEMSKEEIAQRQLSALSGVPLGRIRSGGTDDADMVAIMEASNEVYQSNFIVEDMGLQMDAGRAVANPATVEHIRQYSRRKHLEIGLDCIIIDYLQLLDYEGNAGNRVNEVSHMTRQIKLMARELNIPVLQLSQLSRDVEKRADKRPMLSDLRDSGTIEQDSDIVIFLYRDDYYHDDSETPGISDAIIAKHRHGETGTVKLLFKGGITKFVDVDMHRVSLEY